MKSRILQLLKEKFVLEADVDQHTYDRVNDRINKMNDVDLSKETKEKIFDTLSKIRDTDFPKTKSYVIFLGQFNPNPKSEYFEIFKNKPYYRIENSVGNQFWVIIRNNKVDTFMLAMDYQTNNPEANANRLNVDYSIRNIDKFIEALEKAKLGKKDEPVVIINGVRWIVDGDNEVIYKKNKSNVKHNIMDIMNNVDQETQEKIMSFI